MAFAPGSLNASTYVRLSRPVQDFYHPLAVAPWFAQMRLCDTALSSTDNGCSPLPDSDPACVAAQQCYDANCGQWLPPASYAKCIVTVCGTPLVQCKSTTCIPWTDYALTYDHVFLWGLSNPVTNGSINFGNISDTPGLDSNVVQAFETYMHDQQEGLAAFHPTTLGFCYLSPTVTSQCSNDSAIVKLVTPLNSTREMSSLPWSVAECGASGRVEAVLMPGDQCIANSTSPRTVPVTVVVPPTMAMAETTDVHRAIAAQALATPANSSLAPGNDLAAALAAQAEAAANSNPRLAAEMAAPATLAPKPRQPQPPARHPGESSPTAGPSRAPVALAEHDDDDSINVIQQDDDRVHLV
ncbi:hypothetical protein RI367_006329 [Sorochytrium milnesiophthora]